MTTIDLAHLRIQGVNVAVFSANSRTNTDASRRELLMALTMKARGSGLRVEKAALAYRQGSRNHYFGTPDLVRYLKNNGVPRWTHTVNA
jgi:hypothetical protein